MSAVDEKAFVSSGSAMDSPSLMSQLKQNPIVPIGKFYRLFLYVIYLFFTAS